MFMVALFVLFVYLVSMKTQRRLKKVKQTNAAPVPSGEVIPETTPALPVSQVGPLPQVVPPPPEFLLSEAMAEPDRRLLEEYGDTIRVLRDDKRFTFREIAEWLQEYGVECDHNAVYREYTKGLSYEEERDVALRDAEEEDERP
jgi:hypothetical protein